MYPEDGSQVQNICHAKFIQASNLCLHITIESTLGQSLTLEQYLSISFCFLQEVGTLMPLQSSHQRKSDTVCLSKGSEISAPGISAGESVTSTSSVAISNKSCCFSRMLRSIHMNQNSTCSPESLVLRCTHLNSTYRIVVEWREI